MAELPRLYVESLLEGKPLVSHLSIAQSHPYDFRKAEQRIQVLRLIATISCLLNNSAPTEVATWKFAAGAYFCLSASETFVNFDAELQGTISPCLRLYTRERLTRAVCVVGIVPP
jgi:hypothetical protein